MSDYDYISRYTSTNYTPKASCKKVFGRARTIAGITIHHWGNTGQKFDNVRAWLDGSTGNTATSAHEVIEAGKVAVIVNHKDAAWHAGNAVGNASTIGLELRPEATKGDYETAAQRIAELRDFYKTKLPLYPHKHWKSTACPGKWDLAKLDRMAEARRAGATPSKPKPPTPSKGGTHKVLPGQTLGAIANHYGTTVSVLAKLNGIKDPNLIQRGATLDLPASARPATYKIKAGDTLGAIAARFKTTVGALQSANGIRDANKIRAGQTLKIK